MSLIGNINLFYGATIRILTKADEPPLFEVVDDKIGFWNTAKLGPQPTLEFLEQKAKELAPQIAAAEFAAQRRAAYMAESDPLFLGAMYDSLRPDGQVPLEKSDWAAKVVEIKTRLPKTEVKDADL